MKKVFFKANMIKKLFISSVLLVLAITSIAQVEQSLRVEIEVDSHKGGDHKMVAAGEHGLVIFASSDERLKEKTKVKWLFTGYNTDFRETWRSGFVIHSSYTVKDYYYEDGNVFVLFGSVNKEAVQVVIINVRNGVVRSLPGKLPRKFAISTFQVYQESAYILGEHRKKPAMIYFDIKNGNNHTVPLDFSGPARFESIDVDSLHDQVNIAFTVSTRRESFLNIKSFKRDEMISDLIIDPDGNDNLLTGKLNTISEEEKVIIGTYAVKGTTAANGLYFARLINDEQYKIKYYNFSNFSRFFDFLPNRQHDKIMRKKKKQEAKGKELNLDYQLLVHKLIKKDGQYIMIAEAYYPTYRTESYPYTMIINGVPIVQYRYVTVFDGWLYTHAIVAGFDYEGNMLWDNSIEMGDFKSFELRPRVTVSIKDDEMVLAYGTFDEIKTKVVKENKIIDKKEEFSIKTGFNEDKVKRTGLSNVQHWYDKYFIAYGYQRIRNDRDSDVKRKRTVFYFNKLALN